MAYTTPTQLRDLHNRINTLEKERTLLIEKLFKCQSLIKELKERLNESN